MRYHSVGSGCGGPNAVSDAIGYAQFYSRSHDVVVCVYDAVGNVIETHEHKGDFKEWKNKEHTSDHSLDPLRIQIRRGLCL